MKAYSTIALTPTQFAADFEVAAQEVGDWFVATAFGAMALVTVAALIAYAVNHLRSN